MDYSKKKLVRNGIQPTQLQIVFRYLQTCVATASMISSDTGIPQKNICRYKRALQKAGLLLELHRSKCRETGREAWYLTATFY